MKPADDQIDGESLLPSTELMRPDETGLLVVDVQEKLMPYIPGQARIVWNIRRLLDAAHALGVAYAGTEQYPAGLGPTVHDLAARLGNRPDKVTFSCRTCNEVFEPWQARGIHRVLVSGIETHVCVQQTVLDLLAGGFRVYVSVDAVGARGTLDHDIALRRMEASGAVLTTTEAALFEWCGQSGTPQFKVISQLVKESGPGGR